MGWRRGGPPGDGGPPEEDSGDDALVRRAASDPAAFDCLFDRYWPRLHRYCYYRLGAWHDAEDVAQAVMVAAARELARFAFRGEPDGFRRWLFVIAHNETVNAAKMAHRRRELPFPEVAPYSVPGPTPEEAAILASTHGWLRELVAQLPPDQREVMELRLAGLENDEIARVLEKKPDNVRQLTKRARARLNELMRQTGGRHG
jgi:RNA polymerase sigma-70 factor (ECF subfamily)